MIKTISRLPFLLFFVIIIFQCTDKVDFIDEEKVTSPVGDSLYTQGDSMYYKEKFIDAIGFYEQAVLDYQRDDNFQSLSNALNDIGLCYRKLGDFKSAISFYKKAFMIDSLQMDSIKLVGRLLNLGVVNKLNGEFVKAIEYYNKSLFLAKKIKSTRNVAAIYNSMGNLYHTQERNKLALFVFEKSLNLYEELKEESRASSVLNNIGNSFTDLQKYDSAIRYFDKAILIKRRLGHKGSLAFSFHNLGRAYLLKKEYELAEKNLLNAYEIRRSLGDERSQAVSANELGDLYLKLRQLDKAKYFLSIARSFGIKLGINTILWDNLKTQSVYDYSIGDFKYAYKKLDEWANIRDSIFNVEKLEVLAAQNKFDLQQKEAEKLIESKRADNANIQSKNRLVIIQLVALSLVVLLIFVAILFRQREKIKRLNKSLNTLNTDIRHRKQNDYQRVLVELDKTGFASIDALSNMLYASVAVDEVLYDSPDGEVMSDVYLDQVIEELEQSLNLSSKKIHVETNFETHKISNQIITKVAYIFSELLTNTVKHGTRKTEDITVFMSTKKVKNKFMICYEDNGSPIDIEKVSDGKGLGWKLMNDFSTQLGGMLEFSLKNEKNTFTLTFKL